MIHTINSLLIEGTDFLQGSSSTPSLDSLLLLLFTLKISKEQAYSNMTATITNEQYQEFEKYLCLRKKLYPISYILGEKEFWKHKFYVTENTLIPRPESEVMIEEFLKVTNKHSNVNVLELGVGCGNIISSIALERPNSNFVGVDISHEALIVANKNIINLGIKNIKLLCSNWFENIGPFKFDFILSNPPYISITDKYLCNSVFQYEPHTALISNDNGYGDLKKIIQTSQKYLNPNGCLFLEHGWRQSETLIKLLLQYSYKDIQCMQDLSGNDRICIAKYY